MWASSKMKERDWRGMRIYCSPITYEHVTDDGIKWLFENERNKLKNIIVFGNRADDFRRSPQ